jgi:hypothetical protein
MRPTTKVERQALVLHGDHELARLAQEHDVERRALAWLEGMLDDVDAHLRDRALEPGDILPSQAQHARRLAQERQAGRQIFGPAGQRDARDPLLCNVPRVHGASPPLRGSTSLRVSSV